MLLKFATKRNTNGNRHYLMIDTEKRQYSTQPRMWHRSDFVEVTKADYNELIENAHSEGFHVLIDLRG